MKRYALVTGGSRGIGRAVCIHLASMGLPVIINYRSGQEAAEETLKAVRETGGEGELLPFDVSDPEAIEKALADWEEKHPDDYIAVLVNNAGIRKDNLMVFMQNEEWHSVVDTTLNGFFYTTRRLLKNMLTHRDGRIINMASLSGLKGVAGQANYSAAKAALIGDEGAGTGGGSATRDGERRGTGIYRDGHDGGPRRKEPEATRANATLRKSGGSGGTGGLPGLGKGGIYHWAVCVD